MTFIDFLKREIIQAIIVFGALIVIVFTIPVTYFIYFHYNYGQEFDVKNARLSIHIGIVRGNFDKKNRYGLIKGNICTTVFDTKKCVALKVEQKYFDSIGLEKIQGYVKSPCSVYKDRDVITALKRDDDLYEMYGQWGRLCLKDSIGSHPTVIQVFDGDKFIKQHVFNKGWW